MKRIAAADKTVRWQVCALPSLVRSGSTRSEYTQTQTTQATHTPTPDAHNL